MVKMLKDLKLWGKIMNYWGLGLGWKLYVFLGEMGVEREVIFIVWVF